MKVRSRGVQFVFGLLALLVLFAQIRCSENDEPTYLNLAPNVKYVGKEACGQCHVNHYQGFKETGMGLSIDTVSSSKSALHGKTHTPLYDSILNLYYLPFFNGERLFVKEYRLENGDTSYLRVEEADFVIGSGQHTNSHLFEENGYVHQMPFTYYTQDGKLDFPPGFEGGKNSRFSRPIGLECMSCHNAYPKFVLGSSNKYDLIPQGIDCERCHGPGEIHVREKLAGNLVDTSKFIDYTIVNPAKLSVDLQFEVCQRCHLQGNAVLQEGKSFLDFKPGMKLSEVMEVYIPRYSNSDEEFIMASHVDRLKSSNCFKATEGELVCFSCHNPHKSVVKTGAETFNSKCTSCHSKAKPTCQVQGLGGDCFGCHMPKSSSIDIPHVSITDHKISIPREKKSTETVREFLNLYCVNNPNPTAFSRAKAFLNQFEKFDPRPEFLDSAEFYLNQAEASPDLIFQTFVRLSFLRGDHEAIGNRVEFEEKEKVLSTWLNTVSYANEDAWTAYRIGQAFDGLEVYDQAYAFYAKAVELAPFILDFKVKFGVSCLRINQVSRGKQIFEEILEEDKNQEEAWNNLGFIYLQEGLPAKAKEKINQALNINPNYILAWLNLAQAHLMTRDVKMAEKALEEVIRIQPNHGPARDALAQIREEND